MNFHFITLFPDIYKPYLETSILGRAQKDKKISFKFYNPRDFSKLSKSQKNKEKPYAPVDNKPYGGGAGMVLQAEPILKAVDKALRDTKYEIRDKKKPKVVIFGAKGKPFNQKMSYEWAKKHKDIIFIAGRYEGIDERVKKALKAEEISIGPYVLTDGDVAAMVITSSVARLLPGVIRLESLKEESHWNLLLKEEKEGKLGESGLEYPHYTRPEVLVYKNKKYKVPKILLSGNHKKIEEWRRGGKS